MMIELLISLSLLTSFDETRFINSQKQLYDTSCGFSSVATLMNNWYGEDINEQTLITETFTENKISENEVYSLSLNTLKEILQKHGYFAKAYNLDYNSLIDATEKYPPVIVHYSKDAGHFLLVIYADENNVFISDPACGTNILYRSEFEKLFSGNVLLVHGTTLNEDQLKTTVKECADRLAFLQHSWRFL